jgi:hypothetical protein
MTTKISDIHKDVIHEQLKDGGRVCQTKGNYIILEGAEFEMEGCLPFILFLDTY